MKASLLRNRKIFKPCFEAGWADVAAKWKHPVEEWLTAGLNATVKNRPCRTFIGIYHPGGAKKLVRIDGNVCPSGFEARLVGITDTPKKSRTVPVHPVHLLSVNVDGSVIFRIHY